MNVSRRSFVLTSGFAAATSFLTPAAFAAESRKKDSTDYSSWRAVSDSFSIDRKYVHLGLFYLASHPRPVREAIEYYRQQLDANPYLFVERSLFEPDHLNLEQEVRKAIAAYARVDPEDIALTGNTTAGLALIYHGLSLGAGDEILTTAHDHAVHHEAIRLSSERTGATTRRIALFDSFDAISEEEIVGRIDRAIRPETRVVGVTWVHSSSGLKLPVKRIAEAIAAANRNRPENRRILLVVDGVHGLGVEPPDLASLGADFFAAGTHKWVFAPRGTGFVWAPSGNWALLRPTVPTFSSFELYEAWMNGEKPKGPARANWFSPGGFHAYEHFWAVPTAFDFHQRIGPARVTERIHALNTQMKEGLAGMQHVKLYTPKSPGLSAGMTCFDVAGLRQTEVAARLLQKNVIATTTPYRASYARVAPGLANTEQDVEKTLAAIRSLA
jgi:isopenicillin-N epimerase